LHPCILVPTVFVDSFVPVCEAKYKDYLDHIWFFSSSIPFPHRLGFETFSSLLENSEPPFMARFGSSPLFKCHPIVTFVDHHVSCSSVCLCHDTNQFIQEVRQIIRCLTQTQFLFHTIRSRCYSLLIGSQVWLTSHVILVLLLVYVCRIIFLH
jgi:hypothetical protein